MTPPEIRAGIFAVSTTQKDAALPSPWTRDACRPCTSRSAEGGPIVVDALSVKLPQYDARSRVLCVMVSPEWNPFYASECAIQMRGACEDPALARNSDEV